MFLLWHPVPVTCVFAFLPTSSRGRSPIHAWQQPVDSVAYAGPSHRPGTTLPRRILQDRPKHATGPQGPAGSRRQPPAGTGGCQKHQ